MYLGADISFGASNLYNGNIGLMDVNIEGLEDAMTYYYKYDQLHRIKQMNSSKRTAYDAFQMVGDFNTNYSYDGR